MCFCKKNQSELLLEVNEKETSPESIFAGAEVSALISFGAEYTGI